MVALAPVLLVMSLCAAADWLHHRRTRRMAYLAFGPAGKPRDWTAIAPPLRAACAGLLCWGLLVLLFFQPRTPKPGETSGATRHLVLGIDVSPSMNLADAGPGGRQTRADRAREVLRSVIERIDTRNYRISIVAFYTGAKPVVVDTVDLEVIQNILADLPMQYAFNPGRTTLYESVRVAAELARTWQPGSTTLLLISDGDTLPPETVPSTLPPSVAKVVVVGVGDSSRGLPIDGHLSRQDHTSLSLLAGRFGGIYSDANTKHLPTELLHSVFDETVSSDGVGADQKDWALAALAAGAAMLTMLSPALALAGAAWPPDESEKSSKKEKVKAATHLEEFRRA